MAMELPAACPEDFLALESDARRTLSTNMNLGRQVPIRGETPRGVRVLLLGNDAGSLEELERSVQAINRQLNQFNVPQSDEHIQRLREQFMTIRG